MGKDLIANFKLGKRVFQEMSDACNFDLLKISQSGSSEDLNDGQISGLLVVALSIACSSVLEEAGVRAAFHAGYSVGHYGALFGAGCIELSELSRLVALRGGLLKKAASIEPRSSMLGVIGLSVEDITKALNGVDFYFSNYNVKGNYSISIKMADKEKCISRLLELNAIKVVPLEVEAGWHSPFVKSVSKEYEKILSKFKFAKPQTQFFSNVTGEQIIDASTHLIEHIYSPVRWDIVQSNLGSEKPDIYIELGEKNQLSTFLKFSNRKARVISCRDISKVLSFIT